MRRRLLLVLLAAVGAVALAGCGAVDPDAATVDGDVIPRSQLTDELDAIQSNRDYVANLEAGGVVVTGAGTDTITSSFTAQVLTRQIVFTVIDAYAAAEGVAVDPSVEEEARQDTITGVGGEEVFSQFPQSYQDWLVEQNATALAVQLSFVGLDALDEESLRSFYEQATDRFEEVCLRHILLETEAAAGAVLADLEGGADFGVVAAEQSIDVGSAEQGGDLGCQARGAFVAEFEDAAFDAPVGQIVGPVQTQFGFHLILVTERQVPDFDDVQPQVLQIAAASAEPQFSAWLEETLVTADVSVDPRYGSWNDEFGGVVPPEPPVSATQPTLPLLVPEA